jgi:ketosteroid isomerase-like protein
MSQENVEITLESFQRFRPSGLDEWARMLHPDAEITAPNGWPEQGPFIGREAVLRQFKRMVADWSEVRFEDIELAAESGDWVVMTWRWITRGATSGITAEFDLAGAFRIEDGLIIEGHFRWNRDEALGAAGLTE